MQLSFDEWKKRKGKDFLNKYDLNNKMEIPEMDKFASIHDKILRLKNNKPDKFKRYK